MKEHVRGPGEVRIDVVWRFIRAALDEAGSPEALVRAIAPLVGHEYSLRSVNVWATGDSWPPLRVIVAILRAYPALSFDDAVRGLANVPVGRPAAVTPRPRLHVEIEEVPGEGWVVEAQEVAAIAQGATPDEALANLRELLRTYPEALAGMPIAPGGPEVELIPA